MEGPCVHTTLVGPSTSLHHNYGFVLGFFSFLGGRGFKEMSMLCPTLVDQQTREETSQYFLEGRKEGERYYTTQPQTMSRTSMGIQDGRGGCLMRLPWGGGSRHSLKHTSAPRLACTPLHLRPHRVHTGYTLIPAPQGHGHTQKEALPSPVWHGGEPVRARHVLHILQTRKLEEQRRRSGQSHPPDCASRVCP